VSFGFLSLAISAIRRRAARPSSFPRRCCMRRSKSKAGVGWFSSRSSLANIRRFWARSTPRLAKAQSAAAARALVVRPLRTKPRTTTRRTSEWVISALAIIQRD
jgi:hypothetical protein